MALIVDYNELESLGKSINTSTNDWFGSLESISNAIQTLSGSSNIQGQAADNVKSYLYTVHSSIIAAFGSIMSAHAQNYLLYKREYQSDIDSALHARILQDEILRIQENVQKNKDSTQDVDITIKNAIADISDIIHLGFPGSGAVESIEEDIIKDITELDNNIIAVENRHYRSDFTETTQLMDALEQLLHQQLGTQRHYKSNFSIDSLGSNKAFLDFAGALSTLAQVQEGKSDAVERAYAEEEQWQERLYEERQREAEAINWLVTGLCIVGSVVAIAATGGAATPLVVATISGISGAVSAGTQSLTSQYVETGDWGDTNWAEVGKDAFVGGLAGFATGYIGTAGSQAITSSLSKVQPVSKLLNSSSTATRVLTHGFVGATTESTVGIGTRFVGTTISTGGDIGAAARSATDVKSILTDASIGAVSAGIAGKNKTNTIKKANDERPFADCSPDEVIARRTDGLDLNPHPSDNVQLSKKKMSEIRSKIDNRTATKAEYDAYEWNQKMQKRRTSAVDKFWADERQRITENNPTRNWNPEQTEAIMKGRKPKFEGKTIQGHHTYSVSQYPHLADNPDIIYPCTYNEHFQGWHGGNWKNSLPGRMIKNRLDF